MDVERRSGTFAFGREEGRRDALRELVVKLLGDRGVEIDGTSEARINDCQDLPALQRWVVRAMQVHGVDELFGD